MKFGVVRDIQMKARFMRMQCEIHRLKTEVKKHVMTGCSVRANTPHPPCPPPNRPVQPKSPFKNMRFGQHVWQSMVPLGETWGIATAWNKKPRTLLSPTLASPQEGGFMFAAPKESAQQGASMICSKHIH